jgi:hypothetical protein
VIPRKLLPEVWGVPQNLLSVYMNFDDQDCVVVGKEKFFTCSLKSWCILYLKREKDVSSSDCGVDSYVIIKKLMDSIFMKLLFSYTSGKLLI